MRAIRLNVLPSAPRLCYSSPGQPGGRLSPSGGALVIVIVSVASLTHLRRVFNGLVKVVQLQVTCGPIGIQSWNLGVEPDGEAVGVNCPQEVLPHKAFAGEKHRNGCEMAAVRPRQPGCVDTYSPLSFNQSGFLCDSSSSCSSAWSALTTCRASACLLSHCTVHTRAHPY